MFTVDQIGEIGKLWEKILRRNGWKYDNCKYESDYNDYEMAVSNGDYNNLVHLYLSGCADNFDNGGDLGVLGIEAGSVSSYPFASIKQLKDRILSIEYAEDNLLAIGVPFASDYEFHGRNAANKKRRNQTLRKKYNLEEIIHQYVLQQIGA